MSIRRFTEVEAYQHADDGYYYRPLVAGKELFSYVAPRARRRLHATRRGGGRTIRAFAVHA